MKHHYRLQLSYKHKPITEVELAVHRGAPDRDRVREQIRGADLDRDLSLRVREAPVRRALDYVAGEPEARSAVADKGIDNLYPIPRFIFSL